jgi:nicotinate-nucleotide adenylyltransferase
MKIGLFFGSFNPIHYGHLIIAECAANEAQLNRVWFVVSPHNPLKIKQSLLGEYDRLRMVELAIEGNHTFHASNVEFSLAKPSFTIDTLTYLFDKYRSYEFSLIMGEDNLLHIHKWKNYEAILNNYKIYVYPRPNSTVETELKNHPNVHYFSAPLLDISATEIRTRLKSNKSIRYLVPDNVREYLISRKLYAL